MKFKLSYAASVLACLSLTACMSPSSRDAQQATSRQAANANIQMGMAYLERSDTVQAKQRLMAALQEAPKSPASWYAMGYYNEVTGNLPQADQQFRKAIALAPDSGEAHNNYGTFLCRTGKYQAAIAQFKKAIAEPSYIQDGAAYENAGICALQMPNKKLAMHYFQQALLNDPNLTNSLLHLGELSFETKDYVTARNCLKRYLKLHQANEDSDQLKAQLANLSHKKGHVNQGNQMVNQRFKEMTV